MKTNTNYYQILELSNNANSEQIKKKYRELVRKYHPDHNPDNQSEAEKKLKLVYEAYEILGDERKRNNYDFSSPYGKNYNHRQKQRKNPFANFWSDFNPDEDINDFGSFSERYYQRKKEPTINLDIEKTLRVSLNDIYHNLTRYIRYTRRNYCDHDGGDKANCTKCNGTGFYDEIRKLNISHIHRITHNKTQEYENYGHAHPYSRGQYGKLIVHFEVDVDSFNGFYRDGDDLKGVLKLPFKVMWLGSDKFNLYSGTEPISIKIKPRMKPGQRLRISKKGFLHKELNCSEPPCRGDIILEIELDIKSINNDLFDQLDGYLLLEKQNSSNKVE